MPRQGRIDIIGCLYHIISRGINKGIIFKDNYDREEFVKRLSEAIKKTGTICYGWALMPNHFHLLVKRGKKPISDLMRRLLTGYALFFNRKHKRSGYLFQNRYKSILCQEENYLLELIRYIHLNPIRAGLVNDIKQLSKYLWTGYSALMGIHNRDFQESDEILERFGKNRKSASIEIEKFMEDGLLQGKREDLTGGGLRRSAGGWSEVLKMSKAKEYWRGDERILGEGSFVESILKEAEMYFDRMEENKRKGHTLEALIEKVCLKYNIEKRELKKKGHRNIISEAKSVLAYTAKRDLGIKCKDLSVVLGCTEAAISLLIKEGEKIVENEKVILLS